mgnify:CR=1 FL=1
MVSALAARHAVPILFCNQVGGNDELVFDGASFAVDAHGRVLASLPHFETALEVFELDKARYVQKVYGTERFDHPGGRMVESDPRGKLLGAHVPRLCTASGRAPGQYGEPLVDRRLDAQPVRNHHDFTVEIVRFDIPRAALQRLPG